jgi:hypothetical protein
MKRFLIALVVIALAPWIIGFIIGFTHGFQ